MPGEPVHARRFVSEALVPVEGSFDVAPMLAGEPGLPRGFRWRDREYAVARVLEKWKTTSRCHHGSPEQYVRKHWFRVLTTDGTEMELYFERQPRRGQSKQRWWIATVADAPDCGNAAAGSARHG